MKKVNWFQRLFLSWNTLVKIINKDSSISDHNYSSMEKAISLLEKQLEEKKRKIEKLEDEIKDKVRTIETLKTSENDVKIDLNKKIQMIDELKEKITFQKNQADSRMEEIRKQLLPLDRINKIFFGQTGNKGKGELGELQIKTILEKMEFDSNFWVENLKVGSNNVEFAIQSGIKGKWIPVDSKVVEPKVDDENKIIIDDDYRKRIKIEAQKISKYNNKKNTASYSILVLPNDEIYSKLFDNFPQLFQEIQQEYKVHINSPSTFIQSAWNIASIVEIYNKISNDEKVYEEINSILESIGKFATKLKIAHKAFNVAMDTHYPTIENKHTKLIKQRKKVKELKQIPSLHEK